MFPFTSFRSDEEIKAVVPKPVNAKVHKFFNSGMMALEHGCVKCIIMDGNYTETEELDDEPSVANLLEGDQA